MSEVCESIRSYTSNAAQKLLEVYQKEAKKLQQRMGLNILELKERQQLPRH